MAGCQHQEVGEGSWGHSTLTPRPVTWASENHPPSPARNTPAPTPQAPKEMASVTFMPICHLSKGPAGGAGGEDRQQGSEKPF